MRTLELFAGIGGLAFALPPGFELVAAGDQDEAARRTHELNHGVLVLPLDLASATAHDLARHGAEAWLLSPPCQPFSRRGRGRDVDDPRCRGLLRTIELMAELRPRRVLVENVAGFHGSRAHALLDTALRELGHDVRDVTACPSDLGWPIRRPRQFTVSSADGLARADGLSSTTRRDAGAPRLDELLDAEPGAELLVPAALRARIEPVHAPPVPLATLTRSYGRALAGGGPILPSVRGPRFLSPDEILRLHAFPGGFLWPEDMSLPDRWRLAGNSVHVACVRHVLGAWT